MPLQQSATHTPGSPSKHIASSTRKEVILPLCSAVVRPLSGLPCPVLVFSLRKDTVIVERVYERVTKMVRGLKNMMCKERLRAQPDKLAVKKAKRKLCG